MVLLAVSADKVLKEDAEQQVASSESDEKVYQHPTREERLEKHIKQCQNLILYLMSNTCLSCWTKKEIRNIKNQAKMHQWDRKSKFIVLSQYSSIFSVYYSLKL